jgi:hypothetical protein
LVNQFKKIINPFFVEILNVLIRIFSKNILYLMKKNAPSETFEPIV